jgi:hypothetical protein
MSFALHEPVGLFPLVRARLEFLFPLKRFKEPFAPPTRELWPMLAVFPRLEHVDDLAKEAVAGRDRMLPPVFYAKQEPAPQMDAGKKPKPYHG